MSGGGTAAITALPVSVPLTVPVTVPQAVPATVHVAGEAMRFIIIRASVAAGGTTLERVGVAGRHELPPPPPPPPPLREMAVSLLAEEVAVPRRTEPAAGCEIMAAESEIRESSYGTADAAATAVDGFGADDSFGADVPADGFGATSPPALMLPHDSPPVLPRWPEGAPSSPPPPPPPPPLPPLPLTRRPLDAPRPPAEP